MKGYLSFLRMEEICFWTVKSRAEWPSCMLLLGLALTFLSNMSAPTASTLPLNTEISSVYRDPISLLMSINKEYC